MDLRRLTGSFSVSASTTLYGLFPINIFNANSLRHVMYPTLSLTYSPNYNDTFFGYDFGYFSNVDGISTDYFRNTMIGSTPEYENKRFNINIRNSFQIKLNDSANTKVDFLTWNINSGYNFNPSQSGIYMDVIKSRINLNIPEFLDIDFTMFHDPYKLDDNLTRTGNLSPIPVLTYIQGATDISIEGFKKQSVKLDSNIDTLNRDEKASLFNSNNFFNKY